MFLLQLLVKVSPYRSCQCQKRLIFWIVGSSKFPQIWTR
uniref:Uncharacterized protein n=1 Tax=Arundo donax TaxID=35708 RepID=A0A0A9GT97_ARUDO